MDRQNFSRCQEHNLLFGKDHFHRMRKDIRQFISSVDNAHSRRMKDQKVQKIFKQQQQQQQQHDMKRPQTQYSERCSMKLSENQLQQQVDTTSQHYLTDTSTPLSQHCVLNKHMSLPALAPTTSQQNTLSCSQSQKIAKPIDNFQSKHHLNQIKQSMAYGREDEQNIRTNNKLPIIHNKVSDRIAPHQQSNTFQTYDQQQPLNRRTKSAFKNVPSRLPHIQSVGQPQDEMMTSHYQPRPPTAKRNTATKLPDIHTSQYGGGLNNSAWQQLPRQRELDDTLQNNPVETSIESQNKTCLPHLPQQPRPSPRLRQKSANKRNRRRVNHSPQQNYY